MYIHIFRRLQDAIRKETPWKTENQVLVYPSWQSSSTLVSFDEGQ